MYSINLLSTMAGITPKLQFILAQLLLHSFMWNKSCIPIASPKKKIKTYEGGQQFLFW